MQNQSKFSSISRWVATHQLWLGVVILLLLVAAPLVIGKSGITMRVFILIFINSLLALGLMVITGYAGMINMGHAAFYGIGAYIAAILALTFKQPFIVCFIAATVGAGIAGFLIAFPCLRVATDFLSLITIALGEVFQTIVLNWMDVTRGPMGLPGIPDIEIAGFKFTNSYHYYYLYLAVAVLAFVALSNIMNSRVGRSLKAIRDDETCARAQGINVNYYKVLAFVLGTVPAGMAGAMIAFFVQFVGASTFKFDTSLIVMNMVILGGLGSLPGAIIGSVFFVGVTEIIRPLAVYRVGVGGIIMILLMLFRPQGLLGTKAFAGTGGLENALIRFRHQLSSRKQASEETKCSRS